MIDVLEPKGWVAGQERDLIVTATLLMLIVVIPVFILTAFIAWKYRAKNSSAKYHPEWDSNKFLEAGWWIVPGLIILVLSVMTWNSSHKLDPFKPLQSTAPPIKIQAVALQWKWLFIYPQQNIASVNEVQFPLQTPVSFEITADAPMNSFWIPRLGGQVYAMSGMKTNLHLIADQAGSFRGSSANISGHGFAGMNFTAVASPPADFEQWVQNARHSSNQLNYAKYDILARPSENNQHAYFSAVQTGLFDAVINKFNLPGQMQGGMNYGNH